MVEPGTVLAGKYRVEAVLGEGGMGIVVAAYHLHLGQRVALKFLRREALSNHEAVDRFTREARAAARLRSEHVGRIVDVGIFDDGTPYIVMELLEGNDLSRVVASRGPLSVPSAVAYVLQACEGIAEAHALGIIHRNLKPANLFLTQRPDGSPLIKVLDFGIAKASQDVDFRITRTASVMGSPGYMSPEQFRSSHDVDARTDVWSLGVVLYELVTGQPPFEADSVTGMALKVAMDPTPALHLPTIPSGFDAVVYRCLEKDPASRFGNVAALAAALAPFGGRGAVERAEAVARVLDLSPAAAVAAAALTMRTTLGGASGALGDGAPARRRPWVALATAAVVLAAAAIVLVVVTGGSTPAASQAPAAAPAPTAIDAAPLEAAPTPATGAAPDAAVPAIDAGLPTDAAIDASPDAAPKRRRPRRDDDLNDSRY